MKNFKQFITFWDYIIRLCLSILSILFLSLNLCLVYLSSDIPYSIVDNFFIYLFVLKYERFLVIGFINELVKNLSTLRLIVSKSAK